MAGATDPRATAWPQSNSLGIPVRIGANALIPVDGVVDIFIFEFDCMITKVVRHLVLSNTNYPDEVTLKTIDSTALTIVADLAPPSAAIAGVTQTLHADVSLNGVPDVWLVKGNGIIMTMDCAGTAEGAICIDTVYLLPRYS